MRLQRGKHTTIVVKEGSDTYELTDDTETKAFSTNPTLPQFDNTVESIKHAAIMQADLELAHSNYRVRGIARYKWIARRAGVTLGDVRFYLGMLKIE